jgi:hypothetical protein
MHCKNVKMKLYINRDIRLSVPELTALDPPQPTLQRESDFLAGENGQGVALITHNYHTRRFRKQLTYKFTHEFWAFMASYRKKFG